MTEEERDKLVAAIITGADLGYVDHVGYALSLSFDIDRVGSTSLTFSDLGQIGKMITDSKSKDMLDLKGKPCYLYEENSYWRFKEMWIVF